MKKLIVLVLLICGLSGSYLFAEAKRLDLTSSIRDVTVFQNLAEVKRSGSIVIPKGLSTVVIKRLPLSLQENTLTAKVAGAKIVDIRMEAQFLVETRQETVRKLEQEIKDLRKEDNTLADKQKVLRRSLQLLESLNVLTGEKVKDDARTTGKISTGDWDAAMKYTEENNEKKMKDLRVLEEKRNIIATQIAKKEKEITAITGTRYLEIKNTQGTYNRNDKNDMEFLRSISEADSIIAGIAGDRENWVVLTIDAPEERAYDVELKYTLPGADWNPLYDIRAFPDKNTVEIGFSAQVVQTTGEDWEKVNLFLSSASPFTAIEPPAISFWQIQAGQPVYRKEKKQMSMLNQAPSAAKSMQESADYAQEIPLPEPPVFQEKYISVSFPVRMPTSLVSGKDKQKITIDTINLPSKDIKFEYFASPDRTDKVFLFTRITNRQSYPLIAGSTGIFIDSDFIGNSFLDDIQPGEGRDLFLGSDPGITAKKTLVKKFTDTSGNVVKISYFYRINIKNQKSRVISIAVKDVIPMSTSDDVKIKVESITPEPVSTKEETETTEYKNGLRRWIFDLQPKEQKQIELKFSVTYDARLGAWPLR